MLIAFIICAFKPTSCEENEYKWQKPKGIMFPSQYSASVRRMMENQNATT